MQINALFAGKPKPFGPRGKPSSIEKSSVTQLTVTINGTLEDEQGNKKLHGGPEKVLHQYAPTSYRILKKAYPLIADSFVPGSIGENISVEGMDDTRVQVGDIYRMGGAVLQVSAPRAPCINISRRYNENNVDRFVGKQGITGWYYRVIEEGVIRVDDEVHHLERPCESVSIYDLVRAVYVEEVSLSDLQYFSTLQSLDDEWREKCARKATKMAL